MNTFNITFNDNGLTRNLSSEFQRALPKATASVLNKITFESMHDVKSYIAGNLHTTRPFLKNSTQVEPARSSQLTASVGLLDRVTFGERLVVGGTRTPLSHNYIAVPVEARRGASGGITKAQRPSVILAKKGYFVKEVNGVKGIWFAKNGAIKLVFILKPQTDYTKAPYLPWETLVEQSAAQHDYEPLLIAAILKALGL